MWVEAMRYFFKNLGKYKRNISKIKEKMIIHDMVGKWWVNMHFHSLLVAGWIVSMCMEGSLATLTKLTNSHCFWLNNSTSSTYFADRLIRRTLCRVIHYNVCNGKTEKEKEKKTVFMFICRDCLLASDSPIGRECSAAIKKNGVLFNGAL